MKRLAWVSLLVAMPAAAAMGVLVATNHQSIGGTLYTVCTYNVGGTMINQMYPGLVTCPLSINM